MSAVPVGTSNGRRTWERRTPFRGGAIGRSREAGRSPGSGPRLPSERGRGSDDRPLRGRRLPPDLGRLRLGLGGPVGAAPRGGEDEGAALLARPRGSGWRAGRGSSMSDAAVSRSETVINRRRAVAWTSFLAILGANAVAAFSNLLFFRPR